MPKQEYIQLEDVKTALEKYVHDETTRKYVLDLLSGSTVKINETQTEETDNSSESDSNKDKEPKVKSQFIVVVADKDKTITKDYPAWVLQIPEDEDHNDVIDGIKKGAYNYNASKKGRKYPVSSIGQAIANVPTKFFKPYNIKLKTKEPTFIVVTDNILPRS